MKAIKIKVGTPESVRELYTYLVSHGFAISNPDNIGGEYLTVYVRNAERLAGMDLFINDNEFPVFDYNNQPELVLDWIKDHEYKGTARQL